MILTLVAALASAPSVAEMKWQRRVLVVAAPGASDPALAAQREALRGWRRGAEDRDVQVVEVIGDRVTGARDTAAALRTRLRLPASRFAVVLIGKDGHVALRSAEPVSADTLQGGSTRCRCAAQASASAIGSSPVRAAAIRT